MTFQKGNIIWVPRERRDPHKLRHAAVVWSEHFDEDNDDFHGIMLTHREPSERFDNILMDETHFENGHKFIYENTHFVNQVFTKFHYWRPFYLAGNLTDTGIQFIESRISNSEPIEFEKYIRR